MSLFAPNRPPPSPTCSFRDSHLTNRPTSLPCTKETRHGRRVNRLRRICPQSPLLPPLLLPHDQTTTPRHMRHFQPSQVPRLLSVRFCLLALFDRFPLLRNPTFTPKRITVHFPSRHTESSLFAWVVGCRILAAPWPFCHHSLGVFVFVMGNSLAASRRLCPSSAPRGASRFLVL